MASSDKIIKIAVTGPESSGKSFTAEYLAREFDGWYVPEYAREYLNQLGHDYSYADVLKIAHGQMDVEEKVIREAMAEEVEFVFFDSELINTLLWCEIKFNLSEDFIHQAIQDANYDHYLLMQPDIPWEFDPLRENPDNRNELFDKYIDQLEKHNKSYTIISGDFDERNELSKAVVRTFQNGQG